MFDIVTVEQARLHLRLDSANELEDTVAALVAVASSIVLTHIKTDPEATHPDDVWPDGVPGSVTAATLLVLGELYERRTGAEADVLSPAVIALLQSQRMPSIA